MSVHLLRQGIRSCRVTAPRLLASTRRSYPSQAAQALSVSSASHSDPPSQAAVEPDVPESSSDATIPRRVGRPQKSSKSTSPRAGPTPQLTANGIPTQGPRASRVDLYLASISAAGIEPQLEDLDRCKPARHPDEDSPAYAEAYNNLVDTLCRSFSKAQLRGFILSSNIDPRHSRTIRKKIDFAESLIEQRWQWPSLKVLEKLKRDRTEVTTECMSLPQPRAGNRDLWFVVYAVSPKLLFLILGKGQ